MWAANPKGLISPDHLPTDQEIFEALKTDVPAIRPIVQLYNNGDMERAKIDLTVFFKEQVRRRYYFDWQMFPDQFKTYQRLYPAAYQHHLAQATHQLRHFAPETYWRLPFADLTGKEVTAYELRHLARQQKAADMALIYYYHQGEQRYLDYFIRQVADLNRAFAAGAYDDAGNGIYESFRAGLRVQNWLFAHHLYLNSPMYDWQAQYLLIQTLLHHGAQLEKRTKRFSPGNHHTKGLVALFEIAMLLREFKVSEAWLKQATDGLIKHLTTEVNPDGFQFERSIHYHKGDIDNYFRVLQLAQINQYPLPEIFRSKLRSMFDALVYLAQPDRRLPVLQDDTDQPLAESNLMDDIMLVGTLLFDEPTYKYFAGDKISPDRYWLFRPEQLERTAQIKPVPPTVGSVALPVTGYYSMRNGWDSSACQMVISAGLSSTKPDHQHADMLGIVAYAYQHQILPNYQVNYNSPDYSFLKNSWAKNVALIDSLPQASKWQPNEGNSGFGKWLDLPQPLCQVWHTDSLFDHFVGTHNKYLHSGIKYYREVVFFKDGFWLVRDHFQSKSQHCYQQIWQGNLALLDDSSLQRKFDDGSAFIIRQLTQATYAYTSGTVATKPYWIVSVDKQGDFTFNTLLIPISEEQKSNLHKHYWQIAHRPLSRITGTELSSDAELALYKNDMAVLLNGRTISIGTTVIQSDSGFSLLYYKAGDRMRLRLLGADKFTVRLQGNLSALPESRTSPTGSVVLKPGDFYEIFP